MKIGILTQPLKCNYGGILQNYALQQILVRNGHNVYTLDYGSPEFPAWRVRLYAARMNLLHLICPKRYHKFRNPGEQEAEMIYGNIRRFIKDRIRMTETVRSHREFVDLMDKYGFEALIAGSDQCWRPTYNRFIKEMFFDFASDRTIKRLSYAVSFGTDKWEYSPEETAYCRELVRKFDLVTVRESSGIRLCQEHFGVSARQAPDPTMLLRREDYEKLVMDSGELELSEGGIFQYFLDPDNNKSVIAANLERALGIGSFRILDDYLEDVRQYPRVTTWLRAFMDADAVITDSFHGIVFSILFNKPFWVVGNGGRGLSRMSSLLHLFGLEERMLSDAGEVRLPVCDIDWNHVNAILDDERSKGIGLLTDNLMTA